MKKKLNYEQPCCEVFEVQTESPILEESPVYGSSGSAGSGVGGTNYGGW